MRNNHEIALPILQEFDIRATVYVTIGFIGASSPWIGPDGDGAMMDGRSCATWPQAGWELGAHTMTHPDLSTLDYDACRKEIEQSRVALEEIAGAPVETFAYPFGRYGPEAIAAARESGLIAAVTTGSGSWAAVRAHAGDDRRRRPAAGDLLKLTDRYEPLLQSPPMRIAAAREQTAARLGAEASPALGADLGRAVRDGGSRAAAPARTTARERRRPLVG